jgi:chromosome partitioning protein
MARRAKIAKELVEIPSPVTASGGKSARVLVFCNNKGGVGKTTTVMNLAGALALKEKRVLAIDLDPQCNASIAFNVIIDKHSGTGVRPLLMKEETNIRECLYPRGPWCDFIPADPDLYEIHTDLAIDPRGRFRLRDHLKTMLPLYDYILIDTPPDVSSYTQSALVQS